MLRAAVLGIVQGLTEFIPVSSSAHLVLVPFWLEWPVPDLAFDAAVHLGTALAVIVYFARDLKWMTGSTLRWIFRRATPDDMKEVRFVGLVILGSVPAAIAGFLLEGLFEDLFTTNEAVAESGSAVVGVSLLGTALLLLLAERVDAARRGRSVEGRTMDRITVLDALVVGTFQAFAIAPGLSRSGSTIAAGIFRGLERETAARFSFLLSLPAIAGAALVSLPDVPPDADLSGMIVGGVSAALVGFAAIAFLLRYLRTRTMRPFAFYCALLGAVAIAFWSQTR